jgi:hypothetical protein
MHSSITMTLNSWFELEYYPSCIQNQFKSIIMQVIDGLMNAYTTQCMNWVMKQRRTDRCNKCKAEDQTVKTARYTTRRYRN